MLLCLQSGTIHLQGLGSAKIDFLIQKKVVTFVSATVSTDSAFTIFFEIIVITR